MIIIPKEKPVLQHLNSYYLDMERLIEHLQGEISTGAIYFKSAMAEAVVFFDESSILNVVYQDKDLFIDAKPARDHLIKALTRDNFSVFVYNIEPSKIFFWSRLFHAEESYKEVSAVLTDLSELTAKMRSAKLTGYIHVANDKEATEGQIFFNNGMIIGAASTWDEDARDGSKNILKRLILGSKVPGTTFNIKKIDLDPGHEEDITEEQAQTNASRVFAMLHELIFVLEALVRKNKRIKVDFDTLLNKKFIEKADKYDFIDPFAAEFKYNSNSVEFTGSASTALLIKGVSESIMELAADLEMSDLFQEKLENWSQQYSNEIVKYGINHPL
jgi:hypothetical protein